jgi:hypothetical protein
VARPRQINPSSGGKRCKCLVRGEGRNGGDFGPVASRQWRQAASGQRSKCLVRGEGSQEPAEVRPPRLTRCLQRRQVSKGPISKKKAREGSSAAMMSQQRTEGFILLFLSRVVVPQNEKKTRALSGSVRWFHPLLHGQSCRPPPLVGADSNGLRRRAQSASD